MQPSIAASKNIEPKSRASEASGRLAVLRSTLDRSALRYSQRTDWKHWGRCISEPAECRSVIDVIVPHPSAPRVLLAESDWWYLAQDSIDNPGTQRVFAGISDPTRIYVALVLLEGARNVGELVGLVGSSQGRVSMHLQSLRWCRFAESKRRGKFVYFRVRDGRVRELIALAQDFAAPATRSSRAVAS